MHVGAFVIEHLGDEELILLARTSAAGATDWYLTDRMGSVREIVGAAGAVSYTADYDAFGVREATTGIGGDRWGFTGREADAASGLQYNRRRLAFRISLLLVWVHSAQ